MNRDHASLPAHPISRRRVLAATAAAVTGGAAVATGLPTVAWAADDLVIDLREYGAKGDGVTDDTAVFNRALDAIEEAGGGTIVIPAGRYPVGNAERPRLRDNLKIVGQDATLLKAGPNGALFVALSRGRTGYGSGVRNVRISGLRFLGSYPNNRLVCPFALHHASNVLIEDCVFEQVQGSRHCVDLNGCEDIVIRNCRWLGYNNNEGAAYLGAECIQVDYSYNGALSYNDSAGSHDGLMSRRITVQDCEFRPITVNGVEYPCPNPFGSHGLKEGARFSDLRFVGNLVVDPIQGPSLDDSTDTGMARGAVHLPASSRVLIADNRFVQTKGRMIRAVSFGAGAVAITEESDPNASPPIKKVLDEPLGCNDITIRDNRFEGFVSPDDDTPIQQVIFLRGLPNGGEIRDVRISGNTFVGLDLADHPSTPAIEARHTTGLTITGNTLERASKIAIIDPSCSDVIIEATKATKITGSGPAVDVAAERYRIEGNTLTAGSPKPGCAIELGDGTPGRVVRNRLTGFTEPIRHPDPLPRGVTVRGNHLG
ncbi:glycosyl hydrolase family 28-related protein [Microlunatus speluncae]|uniref:glycosyl hydrolase family 28-related protein n=1 Tax=Microlunatus speluncae TaxID=2594267 RepID=UPI0013759979|nr:glycosyl hydrolase family 28-related protein [Microlunatus speluncae]